MPQIHVEEKEKRTLYVSFFIHAKMGCQGGPQRQIAWRERSAVSPERRNQEARSVIASRVNISVAGRASKLFIFGFLAALGCRKSALAQTDGNRGYLYQLVVFNVFKRFFEREGNGRSKADCLVGTR